MGPRPHLWICAHETVCLEPKLQICMGPRPYLWICACKIARLATELQESLWVPEFTCGFVHTKQRA